MKSGGLDFLPFVKDFGVTTPSFFGIFCFQLANT